MMIDDSMTLDEKLAAIDAAVQQAQAEHKEANPIAAPLDPALLTICDGCE